MTSVRADYIYHFPNGKYITEENFFGVFVIYKDTKKDDRFILIPKVLSGMTEGLFVLATNTGVRICKNADFVSCLTSDDKKKIQKRNQRFIIKKSMMFDEEFKVNLCKHLVENVVSK